jgi:hypothetical protein
MEINRLRKQVFSFLGSEENSVCPSPNSITVGDIVGKHDGKEPLLKPRHRSIKLKRSERV